MKIYITGVSGSGKSSIGRALAAKGIKTVDIDDGFAQWLNKDTGEGAGWQPGIHDDWYAVHGWTCDTEKLKQLLSENDNIVIVGASVNQDEVLPLFDKIYYLEVIPDVIVKRIKKRIDNKFGNDPIEQNRVLLWQKSYGNEMKAKGAISIDAEMKLEEIAKVIISNFN